MLSFVFIRVCVIIYANSCKSKSGSDIIRVETLRAQGSIVEGLDSFGGSGSASSASDELVDSTSGATGCAFC